MKQIKVLVSSLEIRNASLALGPTIKAIKLTFNQAMNFESKCRSFDELIAKYGQNNVLSEGEYYNGYLCVYYDDWKQSIVVMRGTLKKATNPNDYLYADPTIKKAVKKGHYYEIVGQGFTGVFQYVWNFRDCRFYNIIKSDEHLSHIIFSSAEEFDKALKDKLVKGIMTDSAINLTNIEYKVLKSYAPDYFRKFFIELN